MLFCAVRSIWFALIRPFKDTSEPEFILAVSWTEMFPALKFPELARYALPFCAEALTSPLTAVFMLSDDVPIFPELLIKSALPPAVIPVCE